MNMVTMGTDQTRPERILIVDDEPEMLKVLSRFLSRKGYRVYTSESGRTASRVIEETALDLVISDLAMDDINGMELLKMVRVQDAKLPFVMMTGVGNIESAVEAIKLGAYHYISKPFKLQEVEVIIQSAIDHGKINRTLDDYPFSSDDDFIKDMICGTSKRMMDLLKQVKKISDSDASILLQGETGTGKSLLAKIIHENSSRRNKPFLTIDCGALTDTLLESELFGHVKGAFTGAISSKKGLLEEAQDGTVFLDEISEIRLPTQVKLLRVIQEREIKPVGGNQSSQINVRFISATSLDLNESVKKGTFREELYYRLAVIPLYIPSLRERKEDLPLLVNYFLNRFCKIYHKKITQLDPNVMQAFHSFEWKGNIRELANVIERAVLLADNHEITTVCLNNNLLGLSMDQETDCLKALSLKQVVEEAERTAIVNSLKSTHNNRSQAARILGISRRALYDKIDAYGLK